MTGYFWLDPTRTYQRGPLTSRAVGDYERGLVVKTGTASLSVIPHPSAESQTSIAEYFQIRATDEPSELRVITVANGKDAEGFRREFATTPRAQIEKAYLNYYAATYPEIRQTAPISFTDDESENRIEITET